MHRVSRRLRRSFATAAALLAMDLGSAQAQAAPATIPQAASVTYVGNSGFLLRAGGKKILIDALFEGFPGAYALPASVREPLLAGRPPFDGIDLILATHDHADHFSAAMVRRALASNPGAAFVGTAACVAALGNVGGRASALDVAEGRRRTLEINGVTVTAMRLSHGTPPPGQPDIVNLAYLVSAGGVRFFHTGDIDANIVLPAYLESLGVPDDHVDVAFVPHFLLSVSGPLPLVTQGIRPRVVIPSHLQYTDVPFDAERIRRNFPNAVLLSTELETWTVR